MARSSRGSIPARSTDYAAYAEGAVTVVATHPHTPFEPPRAPYVWAHPLPSR